MRPMRIGEMMAANGRPDSLYNVLVIYAQQKAGRMARRDTRARFGAYSAENADAVLAFQAAAEAHYLAGLLAEIPPDAVELRPRPRILNRYRNVLDLTAEVLIPMFQPSGEISREPKEG